ncbi:MAG: MFS transporter [Treponema sp.]|jgi:DHA3 family macrolide efflux protein-like MFS transporter|nr:MFS transporter [Treponema sp.]
MQINWKKNTALFMSGQALTLFGSMVVQYAILWHITLMTKSGTMMTLVTIVGFLPMFFISPFGGVWADRFNRKLVINISDGVIAFVSLVVALLLLAGYTHLSILLICAGIRGLGQGVQMPAVGAVIPQIVPAEHLTRVNGINASVQSLITLTSPMAGAAMMIFFPLESLFFLDVITAAIGISILIFFVKIPDLKKHTEKKKISYFHDLKEGLYYIKNHKFVFKLILFFAMIMIFFTPASLLTPLQVVRKFGDDVWRLSAIEIVFSVGYMLGGLLIAAWGGFKNRMFSIALACFLVGLLSVGLGLSPFFWLYVGVIGFAGMVMPLFNTPIMVLMQSNVEPEFMGRVFSVFTMVSSSVMPFAMLIFGPVTDVISIDYLLVFAGIGLALLSFVLISNKTLSKAGEPVKEQGVS